MKQTAKKECPICLRNAVVGQDIAGMIGAAFDYIGVFGQNASGTITLTKLETRWPVPPEGERQ